jgi:hypothetical protein
MSGWLSFKFNTWIVSLIALAIVGFCLPQPLTAQPNTPTPEIKITPFENNGELEIAILKFSKAKALVELLDERGTVVKTLYAGRLSAQHNTFRLLAGRDIPAGNYTVRYRESLGLQYQASFKRPGTPDGKWLNPGDIHLSNGKLYVYDAGLDEKDPIKKLAGFVRLNLDGSIDTSFADNGFALTGYRGLHVSSMAIDPEQNLYVSNGYHSTEVYDKDGKFTKRYVAGWNNEPYGPICTGWVNASYVGEGNKIYFPTGYGNIKVYDRTKSGFDGALYYKVLPDSVSFGRSILVKGSTIYLANQHGRIERYTDTGKEIKTQYAADPDDKLPNPGGFDISGNILWTCATGPCAGPFWDSGGGGEIVLFHDNGSSIEMFDRFGNPGMTENAVEFLHPSAVAVDPSATTIWVTENGFVPNPAPAGSPPGNARVRQFKVTAEKTAEAKLNLVSPNKQAAATQKQ